MVKRIYLLIAAILLTSCVTWLDRDLRMKKIPYLGDELRIDGYYYSNIEYYSSLDGIRGSIGVAVFYRDGFCIYTEVSPVNQDTLNYIENEFLLNKAYINKLKNNYGGLGVFQIMDTDIQFEVWLYKSDSQIHYGKIVNDTTFITNKRVSMSNKTYPENLTYRFKQFSPKPDSTNVYVK